MVDIQPVDGASIAGSKLSWLGSREGVSTAQTGTLTGFSGVVKAGTPVSAQDGKYVAYTVEGGLGGFVLNDVSVTAGRDNVVAILDRGRVRIDRLPVPFVAPAESGRFVFVSDS